MGDLLDVCWKGSCRLLGKETDWYTYWRREEWVKRDEAEEMYVSALLMCMVTDRSAVLSLVSLKVVANVFSLKHLLIALEVLVFRGV